MKIFILLFLTLSMNYSYAQISANDISGGDFMYLLDADAEETIEIEFV